MQSSMLRWKWIAGGIAVIAIITGGYAWSRSTQKRSDAPVPTVSDVADPTKTYVMLQTFASSTAAQLPGQLLQAYKQGELLIGGSWNVPGSQGAKLEIATPTLSGHVEQIGCGDTHPLCGLYLNSPATTTLLTWGDPMRGFGGVHGFLDQNHARVWSAWSYMAYTNAQERSLDLRDGTQTILDTLELDDNGPSAELTVTRGTNVTLLKGNGTEKNGKNIPLSITMTVNGRATSTVAADQIATLAAAAAAASSTAPAIALSEASFPDQAAGSMQIFLYGTAFTFDPTKGAME